MPVVRRGRKIMHKAGGRWKVKQECSSEDAAKRAFKLLKGLEHGTIKRA